MKRVLALTVAVLFLAAFTAALYAATDKEPSKDAKFMQKAAVGGMFEVEAGKIAAQKGMSDEVKVFGQRMVDDHTKAGNELAQLAESKGVKLPGTLGRKDKEQIEKLNKMKPADFDRQYIDMMVKDHKEDVKEFAAEAKNGKDDDVKAFAAKTLPTLREHLKMAQDIAGKMGGKTGK
jgi:putative membrane protein